MTSIPRWATLPYPPTIAPAHVLAALRKIEARGVKTVAATARGLTGQVFRYAVASHKATQDPTRALAGALAKHDVRNYPPLARDQIGPFLRAIEATSSNLQTKIAGRLLLLTLVRTIELRGAHWDEFPPGGLWRIAPKRMKMRRPHIVPLSRQALELLEELRPITGAPPSCSRTSATRESLWVARPCGRCLALQVMAASSRRMASAQPPAPCFARKALRTARLSYRSPMSIGTRAAHPTTTRR